MAKQNRYVDFYRDGLNYVVVETGQPSDPVRIGVGANVVEAVGNIEDTPIQSAGPDGGCEAALSWAHGAEWITTPDLAFIDSCCIEANNA